MWRIPVSLMISGGTISRTFIAPTLIGNLWVFLGSPAGPQAVNLIIDGVDIGDVQITADWSSGSTFDITCINGGRVIGLGGRGGGGGDKWDEFSGSEGGRGFDGGHAIDSNGFNVNVDIDDGYLLGGGGGGGGGSFFRITGTIGAAGGGGGGGAGFSVSPGGQGGNGDPDGGDGGDGGPSGPGSLGIGAGTFGPDNNDGGIGGQWGSGGQTGRTFDLLEGAGITLFMNGGVGGAAGSAFFPTNSGTITYVGAKNEATLRSESRLKGETDDSVVAFGRTTWLENVTESVAGSNDTGAIFELNGNLTVGNLSLTPTLVTTRWLTQSDTTTAAKYEIRERNLTLDSAGAWTTRVNVTPGTWSALTSDRQQSITSAAGSEAAVTLLEIRRNDVPGNPDTEIIASLWILASDEN